MLFDQAVDPASLLRRSEEEVIARQCKFHRLQLIVLNSKKCLHTRKKTK